MILLRLGSLPKTGLTIMWVLFLFQIIKMFPKMKVDERNAALKVMLVRSLSHQCLTEWNLKFAHAIWIFTIHTNCGIVLCCHIVILNEEVSFKRIFSAALVQGVGEECKTNLCFLNLFLKKTQVVAVFRLRRTNLSKEYVRLRIPSTNHAFIRKGLEVNLALPFS